MTSGRFDYGYDCFRIIRIGEVITSLKSTFLTALQNSIVWRASFDSYRLHHAATLSSPVAGVNIDVFAPQALRTVVGIPCSLHLSLAMLTDEIFGAALKSR